MRKKLFNKLVASMEQMNEIMDDELCKEPWSIHVIEKDGQWYCQCCATPVPFEHICSCELPGEGDE